MSIDLLERGAAALGPLVEQVAFVGGATITLRITDPGAPALRPTKDVDVVVEVATRSALHEFEDELRGRGFRNDVDSRVICRWRHEADDLISMQCRRLASCSDSRIRGRRRRCRTPRRVRFRPASRSGP